ncbi:MAG: hypothetical protein GY866_23965, partial [Proteobacteria bacterium]|nr:hypothetical protein [Pseudomonadota bacterium]
TARKYKADFKIYEDFERLCRDVCPLLAEGKVVGWFQGRMEYGPRALGNRSILADPRRAEIQKKLNLNIKFREGFRPFAPAVLEEETSKYFDFDGSSPYMLFTANIVEDGKKPLPKGYAKRPLLNRLYFRRSDIPAVTHVDYSARIQSVGRETNPRFWMLLDIFSEVEKCGLLVNTSFNVRGEPIVRSPEEAYACFMRTEMDYLVMENCLFDKSDQPEWIERSDWKDGLGLD